VQRQIGLKIIYATNLGSVEQPRPLVSIAPRHAIGAAKWVTSAPSAALLSARARHVSDWTWTYGPHVPTYLPLTVSCYVDLPTPPSFLAFTLDSLAPPVPLHPHDSHESPLPSSPFVPSWLRTPMLPINSPFHGYSPIFDTLYAVLLPD